MLFLYVVGEFAPPLQGATILSASRTTFTHPHTPVVYTAQFEQPQASFIDVVASSVGKAHVVVSRVNILLGATLSGSILWKCPLSSDDVLVSRDSTGVGVTQPGAADWVNLVSDRVYTRTLCTHGALSGRFVDVLVDGAGDIWVNDGRVSTVDGDMPHSWLLVAAHKFTCSLTMARPDRSVILRSGYHPFVAAGTVNGMRLHVESPTRAVVTTTWHGCALSPPSVISGDDVGDVLGVWTDVVHAMYGTLAHPPDARSRALLSILRNCAATPDRELPCRLQVGEYIAYLDPHRPPQDQASFTTTVVTSVRPFGLGNGEHATTFARGVGEIARFDPTTMRVVFPVVKLKDVLE